MFRSPHDAKVNVFVLDYKLMVSFRCCRVGPVLPGRISRRRKVRSQRSSHISERSRRLPSDRSTEGASEWVRSGGDSEPVFGVGRRRRNGADAVAGEWPDGVHPTVGQVNPIRPDLWSEGPLSPGCGEVEAPARLAHRCPWCASLVRTNRVSSETSGRLIRLRSTIGLRSAAGEGMDSISGRVSGTDPLCPSAPWLGCAAVSLSAVRTGVPSHTGRG